MDWFMKCLNKVFETFSVKIAFSSSQRSQENTPFEIYAELLYL